METVVNPHDAYYFSMYAWALLNGCCDPKTQDEFDAMALVPIPFSNVSRR